MMPKNSTKSKSGDKPQDLRSGSTKSLRGMRDVLPEETPLWRHVFAAVERVASCFRFDRIVTPVIEPVSLYYRKQKGEGEPPQNAEPEILTLHNLGHVAAALRPSIGPSIARAYLEHGMHNHLQPVRLWDIGAVFRPDRQQTGPLKQFWEFDFEMIGDPHPVVDATLMHAATAICTELKIQTEALVNSTGCAHCRSAFTEALQQYIGGRERELCEDCRLSVKINPMRTFGCAEPHCQAALADAPQIVDWLCDGCRSHFVQVLEFLDELELPYSLEPRLASCMGHQTRTVFDIVSLPEEGAPQDAARQQLLAGGRYDLSLGDSSARAAQTAGFAGEVERIVHCLVERQVKPPVRYQNEIFIAQLGADARKRALRLFRRLQEQGFRVAESFCKDGLSHQLDQAARLGCTLALILGQKELADRTIIIRDMDNGIQEIVDFDKIEDEVRKHLAVSERSAPLLQKPEARQAPERTRLDLKKEEYIMRETIDNIEPTEDNGESVYSQTSDETEAFDEEEYYEEERGRASAALYQLKWSSEEYEEAEE